MLTVVCWKWKPIKGYRSEFGPEAVNTLRRMVERNYQRPHELVCVTDDPEGIDKKVRVVPIWDDFSSVANPYGRKQPSCYRRLRAFSREAQEILGSRFVSLDLDCVIVDDMVPVWDRAEDFVIWGDTSPHTPYNGSMWLMNAGSRSQVWEKFDPVTSPLISKRMGYFGSDQAWIGACLGPNECKWSQADGVYSYRNDIRKQIPPDQLPSNARIIIFHGQFDPWMSQVRERHSWVRKNYQ